MKKIGQFSETYLYLANYYVNLLFSNLVCKIVYIEGIKCMNLMEIGPLVIEIFYVRNL